MINDFLHKLYLRWRTRKNPELLHRFYRLGAYRINILIIEHWKHVWIDLLRDEKKSFEKLKLLEKSSNKCGNLGENKW